jgi:hypothetical protein
MTPLIYEAGIAVKKSQKNYVFPVPMCKTWGRIRIRIWISIKMESRSQIPDPDLHQNLIHKTAPEGWRLILKHCPKNVNFLHQSFPIIGHKNLSLNPDSPKHLDSDSKKYVRVRNTLWHFSDSRFDVPTL